MDNAKWDEIRLGMYGLRPHSPQWRTRDAKSGYVSPWDGEWFYHFREGGYDGIEWVEIRADSEVQSGAILEVLLRIGVPATKSEHGFKVFGYAASGRKADVESS